MFDLIAQGPQSQRWRKRFRDNTWHMLGRQVGLFGAEWDQQISRQHARIRMVRGGVEVERLPSTANPIFFEGSEAGHFKVRPGQHFVIGQTRFTLVEGDAVATLDAPSPIHQRTFSDQFLRQLDYRDANQRLNVLNRLPEIIAGAADEEQLYDRLASVLLEGVPMANVVAIVEIDKDSEIDIRHWDCREEFSKAFSPSASLIRQAIANRETVLHVWSEGANRRPQFTLEQDADWAFVCPLNSSVKKAQAIYVSGEMGRAGETITTEILHDDLKFTQLVGKTYANVVEMDALQRRQAALRSFFSPVVLDAFAGRDAAEVLEPRACQLSVLFCDLRGFSATSERMSENLLELLNRVSKTLGIMTSCILANGGVVGDFHGDAVMGFWGWPLEQSDHCERAVQTALDIAGRFDSIYESTDFPVSQFMMGLGIASGTAVAGRIGTSDQVKVTAFGPVVNLASRLEGMTRYFRVPILCDEITAKRLSDGNSPALNCRVRRLARVVPYGFHRQADVFRIVPDTKREKRLTDDELKRYDEALTEFENGNWERTRSVLSELPDHDLAKQFVMDFIVDNKGLPPENWDGAIPVAGK
ncbi:MAG: adenylate/guanylate cyclase domain-containing protein [Pirellulaceae bacterium]